MTSTAVPYAPIPTEAVKLLTACQLIVSFGSVFENRLLIRSYEQNYTNPVLNVLQKQITDSSNETALKIELLKDVKQIFHPDETIIKYLTRAHNEDNDVLINFFRGCVFDKIYNNYINDSCDANKNEPRDYYPRYRRWAMESLFNEYMWPAIYQVENNTLNNNDKELSIAPEIH